MPHPTPLPAERANRNAFGVAAAVGAVVWLAVDIVDAERSVRDAAYVAGQSLGTALLAAAPIAFIAWSSSSRWPLWRYPAFIGAIALVLTLISAATGDPAASGLFHQRRTAAVPAVVGAWTRDDSPTTQARIQEAKDQWQRGAGTDGDTADMALYRSGSRQALLIVVTMRPGSGLDEEASDSPAHTVVDELAGAGVVERSMFDPGPLGGALGCGPSASNSQLYLCTWAELGMTGTITFSDTQFDSDIAAEATRDFRAGTEH
jgi:hypothetical protein